MDKKNTIKVYTTSSGAELNISAPSTKQVISATNNRAQYFAEQAKKYRDEAKLHRDNAKYYAEQNSDVTFEYIDNIRASLEDKISTKQNRGDYALKNELPENVSELINDAEYINHTELNNAIADVALPSQEGCAGRFLMSDGENESWVGINSFQLFDIILKDHILTYEESLGWALQGTYVYKEAVAGTRYGYPDFYAKCLEESATGVETRTTLGDTEISLFVNANGHQYYNIQDKNVVDAFYNTYGIAWFYGIDTENERIFLPRNDYFEQATSVTGEVGKFVEAGLPNITGTATLQERAQSSTPTGTGAFSVATHVIGYSGYSKGDGYGTAITFNASKSNSIYGNSNTVQPNAVKKLLYICVGNTKSDTSWVDVVTQVEEGVADVETAKNVALNEIATTKTNVILEVEATGLDSKANTDLSNCSKPYVTATYINGTSGYRLWSDGYCEQWGLAVGAQTVTFLKPFMDTNYLALVSRETTTGTSYPPVVKSRTTTSMYVGANSDTSSSTPWNFMWEACGYTKTSSSSGGTNLDDLFG